MIFCVKKWFVLINFVIFARKFCPKSSIVSLWMVVLGNN